MYTELWRVKVQPKVHVFGWKVANDCLATQANRRNRALVDSAVCTIYGMEEETSHHALIRCPRAVALRYEMRGKWSLPDEPRLWYTGLDWFILLITSVTEDQRVNLLLLLWRTWHLLNDVIFGKSDATITGSVAFLISLKTH
jgi:hypothetical protein